MLGSWNFICGMYMKINRPVTFSLPALSFKSYSLLSDLGILYRNKLVNKISEEPHKLGTYDGPNGSLFISILLHNSEFRILNSEFRNLHCEFRNSEFGIVKYI